MEEKPDAESNSTSFRRSQRKRTQKRKFEYVDTRQVEEVPQEEVHHTIVHSNSEEKPVAKTTYQDAAVAMGKRYLSAEEKKMVRQSNVDRASSVGSEECMESSRDVDLNTAGPVHDEQTITPGVSHTPILSDDNMSGSEGANGAPNVETEPRTRKKRKLKYKRTPCYARKHDKNRIKKREYSREWRARNKDYPAKKRAEQKEVVPPPIPMRPAVVGNVSLRQKQRINYSKRIPLTTTEPALPDRPESDYLKLRKWAVKEKRQLENALRSHNPDDTQAICQYIPTKTADEVECYIRILSTRKTDDTPVPDFVAPIDNWTLLCDDLARDMINHASLLSAVVSLCADTASRPSTADPSPDYSAIYQYLAAVLNRKPPPVLGTYESAVVVDLLQTVAGTINDADVSGQSQLMTSKYSVLMSDTAKADEVREALSLAPPVDERSPPLPDQAGAPWTSHVYRDSSFLWPDSVISLPRFRPGRLSKDQQEVLEQRRRVYQTQMQAFTLNPFGLEKTHLRLKKSSGVEAGPD